MTWPASSQKAFVDVRRLISTAFLAATLAWAPAGQADVMSLPVPLRTIYPKDSLQAEDFGFREFEVNDVIRRTYLTSVSDAGKYVASRVLRAGKPVQLRFLSRKTAVLKGEQVIARYVSDGIEIQGMLVLEEDGHVGDVVKARNRETGVTILVHVTQDGTLAVGGRE